MPSPEAKLLDDLAEHQPNPFSKAAFSSTLSSSCLGDSTCAESEAPSAKYLLKPKLHSFYKPKKTFKVVPSKIDLKCKLKF